MMTLDYQLQRPDLVALSKEQRRFAPGSPSRVYYFYVVPLLCAALAIIGGSFAVAAVFSILYVCSAWLVQQWFRGRFRRAVFSDENVSIQTLPQRVTLSADGLTLSSDAGILVYRWPFIRQIVRGSRYVYFVLTPLDRVPIPLRAFRDDEHVQDFMRTAESYANVKGAQRDDSPNGGPGKQLPNAGVTPGPPSVS